MLHFFSNGCSFFLDHDAPIYRMSMSDSVVTIVMIEHHGYDLSLVHEAFQLPDMNPIVIEDSRVGSEIVFSIAIIDRWHRWSIRIMLIVISIVISTPHPHPHPHPPTQRDPTHPPKGTTPLN